MKVQLVRIPPTELVSMTGYPFRDGRLADGGSRGIGEAVHHRKELLSTEEDVMEDPP
jgi:hypothetical protein